MATKTWAAGSSAGSNGQWNTAANWNDDTLPQAGDDVIFSPTYNVAITNFTGKPSLKSLTIEAGYTANFNNSNLNSVDTVDIERTGGNSIYTIIRTDGVPKILNITNSSTNLLTVEFTKPPSTLPILSNSKITFSGKILVYDSNDVTLSFHKYLADNIEINLKQAVVDGDFPVWDFSVTRTYTYPVYLVKNPTTATSWNPSSEQIAHVRFGIGDLCTHVVFRARCAVNLNTIDLNKPPKGRFVIEIYEVDNDEKPTGQPIAKTKTLDAIYDLQITEPFQVSKFIKLVNPVYLSKFKKYATIIKSIGPSNEWAGLTPSTLSNNVIEGAVLISSDNGETWTITESKNFSVEHLYVSNPKINLFDKCKFTFESPTSGDLSIFDRLAYFPSLNLYDESVLTFEGNETDPMRFMGNVNLFNKASIVQADSISNNVIISGTINVYADESHNPFTKMGNTNNIEYETLLNAIVNVYSGAAGYPPSLEGSSGPKVVRSLGKSKTVFSPKPDITNSIYTIFSAENYGESLDSYNASGFDGAPAYLTGSPKYLNYVRPKIIEKKPKGAS